METLYQILGLIGAGLIIWILYVKLKNDKQAFSREKLTQSFSTMGLLGIALIIFVMVLVMLTRM